MTIDIGPFQDIVAVSWASGPPTFLVVRMDHPGIDWVPNIIVTAKVMTPFNGGEVRFGTLSQNGLLGGTAEIGDPLARKIGEHSGIASGRVKGSNALYVDFRKVLEVYDLENAAAGEEAQTPIPEFLVVEVYGFIANSAAEDRAPVNVSLSARVYSGEDAVITESNTGVTFFDYRVTGNLSQKNFGFSGVVNFFSADSFGTLGNSLGNIRIPLTRLGVGADIPEEEEI